MTPAPLLHVLAGAKRRAASRASSDGAVMFVVAMTITALAALGAWSLQSASLEVRMAGYERQSTQTHYISEYGVLAAMQSLNASTGQAILSTSVTTPSSCLSAPTQNTPGAGCMAKACFIWTSAQYAVSQYPNSTYSYASPPGPQTAPYAIDPSSVTGATPGSFGKTSMQGDFVVELTEPANGPSQAGTSQDSSTGGQRFYWVTMSSYGRTQQTTSPVNIYNSEGDEVLRTRVLAGPMPLVSLSNCGP